MNEFVTYGSVFLLVLGFIIFGPIFSIWAVNHLFGTAIAINFWNWLSVVWLHLVVRSYAK